MVKQLKESANIQNFNLLDEDNIYPIANDDDEFKLFGIGGNFLASKKLLDKPIAGKAGKIWCTLHQFGVLYKKLEKKTKSSIFVSHVSPGKESLLMRLMIHFMPDIWISGHMGAPYTCAWNQFTVRDMDLVRFRNREVGSLTRRIFNIRGEVGLRFHQARDST